MALAFIQIDHLNTPRLIEDSNQQAHEFWHYAWERQIILTRPAMKTTATGLFLVVFLMIGFQGGVYGQSSEVTKVLAVSDSAVARWDARLSDKLELVSVKKYSAPSNDSVAQRTRAKDLANRTYWM